MKRTLRIMILLVAIVLVIQTAYASSFQKIDLGTLVGGISSGALGINNNGQIVGYSQNNSGAYQAFLWQNGVMTDIGTHGGYCIADAINDKGQIVGGKHNAFLWQNGVMTDIAPAYSHAYGINNNGQIVGTINNNSGVQHAFLWQNNVMTDLGPLGGTISYASGINDKGQIVGYSQTESYNSHKPNEYHAFLWQNGVRTDLKTLGGISSIATGINNNGQIVGYSQNNSGAYHAFLWQNNVMTDLSTLEGYSNASYALGINNNGQIVGYSYNISNSIARHVFLWQNGVMTDLGTLGGINSYVHGINDKGQIVGSSLNSLNVGSYYNATLWTPLITCYINDSNYQHHEWGQYPVITEFDTFGVPEYVEQEVPLFSNGDPIWMSHVDKLAKIVIDSDGKRTLKTGEKLDLGQGYTLEAKQVDVDGKKVWLEFDKDGQFVDDQIVSVGTGNNTWTYKQTVQGVTNVPVLKVHINQLFQYTVGNFAQIDGLWLIDYANATTLNVGDQIGDYQLETIHSGTGPYDLGDLVFKCNPVTNNPTPTHPVLPTANLISDVTSSSDVPLSVC